jgi:hypothetical protein
MLRVPSPSWVRRLDTNRPLFENLHKRMGPLGMNKGILGWHLSKSLSRFLGILGVIRLLRIVWIGSCTISLIPCEFLFPFIIYT